MHFLKEELDWTGLFSLSFFLIPAPPILMLPFVASSCFDSVVCEVYLMSFDMLEFVLWKRRRKRDILWSENSLRLEVKSQTDGPLLWAGFKFRHAFLSPLFPANYHNLIIGWPQSCDFSTNMVCLSKPISTDLLLSVEISNSYGCIWSERV